VLILDDPLRDIRALEDKYGLILFRMGLSHLFDVGHRNMTDENVEETIIQIKADYEAERANEKIPVMAVDFQCQIIHCAAELAKFSIWTLFAYIKEHVVVETKNEIMKANAAICPNCGSEVKYGDSEVVENDYVYKWTCEECGAYGREFYDMIFSESIIDGEGDE
jgi:predicted RNA-binding Zn-ribbon protein involved in translation (DUF1610 family)